MNTTLFEPPRWPGGPPICHEANLRTVAQREIEEAKPEKTKMTNPIHIISLGAGVQSSTMSLMAAAGEITPMPVAAIFADTQAEPKSVYVWLDWLEKQLPFPVQRVSAGSLADKVTTPYLSVKNMKLTTHQSIPAFLEVIKRQHVCSQCWHPLLNGESTCPVCGAKNCSKLVEKKSLAMMLRQCTRDFKIDPVTKAVNAERRRAGGAPAVLWIGISVDEIYRAKEHRNSPRITNRHPLMEMGMKRSACLEWMVKHKFPEPPRSACTFCPYHNDREWARLKKTEPLDFQEAVNFEIRLQAAHANNSLNGKPFLHRSLKPLSEVDFSTEEERGQLNMFDNECEGMCGV